MSGHFGSTTRAVDGCIVTFELSDGTLRVEQFREFVHDSGSYSKVRKVTREGGAYIDQAVARADKLDAKIVCISTPQTILTDMQGTRQRLDAIHSGREGMRDGMQMMPADETVYPERIMLGKVGRTDLFKRPSGGQTDQNIRQVHQRRVSNSGFGREQ